MSAWTLATRSAWMRCSSSRAAGGLLAPRPAGDRRIVLRDRVARAVVLEHQAVAAADVDPLVQADIDQVFVVFVGRLDSTQQLRRLRPYRRRAAGTSSLRESCLP